MKEKEIRNPEIHKKYLELVRSDSQKLFRDKSLFTHFSCPACGKDEFTMIFVKENFNYVQCSFCETIYNDPRPPYSDIQKLYKNSESTKYWVEKFFTPFKEARREKIFKPRAEYIANKFPYLHSGFVGDVGAGFGIFLDELRKIWTKANLVAIEPSDDMASICSAINLKVVQCMVEEINSNDFSFDLLTSFELVEHLYDPLDFFKKINLLLKRGGYFYFTTLNGLGFDIQILWEKSRSISPPHHLNFFNPISIKILLERASFELIEVSTPGKLDWDIVESYTESERINIGRFFQTLVKHGSDESKVKFQKWISENNFSSHLRVVAKKK